ncbi:MAG TPA: hypothetical protein VEC76_08600 [Streptosporangiaceae bacterium]|nr:hypothetical protein [Streptosporangiaceae bacterium]
MTNMGSEPGEPRPPAEDAIAELPADDAIAEQAAELATEVTEADRETDRRRLVASIAAAARSGAQSGARATGRGVRAARRSMGSARRRIGSGRRGPGSERRAAGAGRGRLLSQVVAMTQRLRIRDQAALRAQFPGLSADEIADKLIEGASRGAAAVGGAVGAWAALPVLPAYPVEVATETLALIGIEVKLVAELHEAYGMPATGNTADRMTAYLAAWAHRRGVVMVPSGLVLAAGSPLARRLRWRLATRMGRSAFSLGPLLTGAMAGAMLNRQETRRLGHNVRTDLRYHAHAGITGWIPPSNGRGPWAP